MGIPTASSSTTSMTLGRLAVTGGGVPGMEVPLLAGEDVPRLGLPGRAIAVLSHYVTGG